MNTNPEFLCMTIDRLTPGQRSHVKIVHRERVPGNKAVCTYSCSFMAPSPYMDSILIKFHGIIILALLTGDVSC